MTPADATPPSADAAPPGGADRRPLLAGLAIGVVMLLVALVIAVSGRGSHDDPSAVAVTGGGERTVRVKLVDLDIVPGEVTVDPGTRLILEVTSHTAPADHADHAAAGGQDATIDPNATGPGRVRRAHPCGAWPLSVPHPPRGRRRAGRDGHTRRNPVAR